MAPPPARVVARGGAKELLLAKMKSLMQQAEASESAAEKRRLLSEIKTLQLGAKENTAQQAEPEQEKHTVTKTDGSTAEKTDVDAEVDT